MNYEKALRFPLAEQGNLAKVIVGAVISLIPIVNFIAVGYLFKLADNIVKGNRAMPAWANILEKFIRGILVSVIVFLYMLIPFLVAMAGGGLGQLSRAGILFGVFVLAFIIAVIIGFFLPMALMNYVGTGKFLAAFDLTAIVRYVNRRFETYFVNYVIIVGLYVLVGSIGLIPVVGWILGIAGAFYISCVGCFLFGTVYREVSPAGGMPTVI